MLLDILQGPVEELGIVGSKSKAVGREEGAKVEIRVEQAIVDVVFRLLRPLLHLVESLHLTCLIIGKSLLFESAKIRISNAETKLTQFAKEFEHLIGHILRRLSFLPVEP